MKTRLIILVLFVAVNLPAAAGSEALQPCTEEWYQFVEHKLVSGDGQGHGPDIGSDEWKSVIEFKLGIRGQPNLPDRDSEDWCQLIDAMVHDQ
jgi:hypothetical protein